MIAIGAIIVALIACSVSVVSIVQLNQYEKDNADAGQVDWYAQANSYADYISARTKIVPEMAIVLGSGLSSFVDDVDVDVVIPYSDLPGFPVSTVAGHAGNFVLGTMSGHGVVIMQGRVHHYEGYSVAEVVIPIRVMYELGARTLFLTNAAGSLNTDYGPGTYMLITDHICMVDSPLVGSNIDKWGDRFFAMNDAYNSSMCAMLNKIAIERGIDLVEGVYVQVSGPQYETPSEVQYYTMIGGDAVGMSTAVETIAARHMGMNVCGISCLTNMAAGLSDSPPTHEEVQEMTKMMAANLRLMVCDLIERMN